MTDMTEEKKIKGNFPNLRFPEFEGEWEEKKLIDIANVYDGTHQTPNYVDTGVRFLSVEDISNKGTKPKYITEEAFEKDFKIKPQKDDILMTRITAGVIGETSIVKTNKPLAYYVSLALIRQTEPISSEYLSTYINSTHFRYELHKRIIHVAFPKKINLKDLGECKVSYPKLIEQEKIATFLSLIKQRIETQNKIIEKYESLIKGISDLLLYSKSDSLISAHLGSLCSIKKGEQVNVIELTDTDSYYVMNGGILPSGYYPNYNTSADTISISEGGNSCGYVQYNSSKFWSGGHCYTLNKINKQIFNKYLYYYLKSQEKNIQALRVGSGLPNIQKKDLERLEIQFPNYEEQEKIVNILTLFPRKIEIEYSLLSVFQKQKEYLLQQMFI